MREHLRDVRAGEIPVVVQCRVRELLLWMHRLPDMLPGAWLGDVVLLRVHLYSAAWIVRANAVDE